MTDIINNQYVPEQFIKLNSSKTKTITEIRLSACPFLQLIFKLINLMIFCPVNKQVTAVLYMLDDRSFDASIYYLISAILFARRMFTIYWAYLQKLIITLTVRYTISCYTRNVYTIYYCILSVFLSEYLYMYIYGKLLYACRGYINFD